MAREETAATLEVGPPVVLPDDMEPFVLDEGRAELFVRSDTAQSFLWEIEAGEAVFPDLPEGASFLLVITARVQTAPLSADEDAALREQWLGRLREFAPVETSNVAEANAQLVALLEERAVQRDAAELVRLQAKTGTRREDKVSPGLSALLAAAARALRVNPPDPLPSDANVGFTDLPRFAQRFGLAARRIRLTGPWYNSDQGPIMLRDRERGAAICAVWRGGYRLPDGTKIGRAAASELDKTAYAISEPLPQGLTGFGKLGLYVLRRNRDELKSIGLAATLMALVGIVIPLATASLLDDIAPSGDLELLIAVGAALFFAGVIEYLLGVVRGMASSRLEAKTSSRLTISVLDRVLRLPASFFREHTGGDLNQRISGIDEIRGLVLSIALSAGLSAFLSIFYFGVLLYFGATLALLSLGMIAVYIIIVAVTRIVMMPLIREAFELDGQIAEESYEMISAVAKLRTAAAETRALQRWANRYRQERDLDFRAAIINAYAEAASDGWQTITQIILFAGVTVIAQDTIPAGSFIAFLVAFGSFQGAFVGLSAQMIELYASQPQIERAMPILKAEPEISEARKDPGALQGRIEVRDVSFGYDNALPPVLSGISLSISPGSHVAIVGGSGSGKSTLLRLLLGFETPRSGSILYDGKDMAELDVSLVRSQIGVVLQSSSLFAGSIIENIRGAQAAGLEQCLDAAAGAGLESDLEGFPMGIHTPITEGASVLSGGQRQRILIARALVANPRILFFDEATSALDNQSQAMVAETLDMMDATRITIAHRLSTVAHADTICVVGQGRILEQGSYDELMAKEGAFAALARRQLIGEN